MTIGLCTLEFHLPVCRSLKEKRVFLKSLARRLANRHNVAVSEIEHQDLWQRATVGIVTISNDQAVVDRTFQQILREVEEGRTDGELLAFHTEYI